MGLERLKEKKMNKLRWHLPLASALKPGTQEQVPPPHVGERMSQNVFHSLHSLFDWQRWPNLAD